MGYCVYVIDSDLKQRDIICSALKQKLAYNVVTFSGGHEAAYSLFDKQSPMPDIILFDITKEGMGAVQGLRRAAVYTPIVTMVKYGDYEAAMASLGAGAQDFLTKPVAIERMSTTFRNMLMLRDARLEAQKLRVGATPGQENICLQDMNNFAFSFVGEDGNIRRMQELEAEAIRRALQHYNGRLTEVARRLGIGRSTLYRKLNELSIRNVQAA